MKTASLHIANEQKISLFVLCNMFDIDVKCNDYEYDDNHSLKFVYNFVLIPKKNYVMNAEVPHF